MKPELIAVRRKTLNQWLKFMLERVGHNNLPTLLDHYENLGWISMDVSDRLMELADAEEQRYVGPSWTLSAEEHRISMMFIEKLQGKQVERSLLSVGAIPRAKPEDEILTKPREGYIEAHRIEREELEQAVARRDVTIRNLEQELEKKEGEIKGLNERIDGMGLELEDCMDEIRKNRVYKGILEENIRVKMIGFYRK